jgi:hypothetical protein
MLRWHGFLQKIINVIKIMYEGFQCKVICGKQLTEPFKVQTGVKHGCVLSPGFYILAIDWMIKETTAEKPRGIQWTLTSFLEDLVFADDITLLTHSFKNMQEKTNVMIEKASNIGLKVNTKKTKLLKQNTVNTGHIIVNDFPVHEVDEFTYLGSMVTTDGDSIKEVKTNNQGDTSICSTE